MSIYRRCSSTSRKPDCISERVSYVWDPTKTTERLCHAWAVDKNHVQEDMTFVKRLFCKLDGRQYLHWVLSHAEGVSPDVADKAAIDVMKMVGEEYQLIVGTHVNTKNVHSHFLINTVNFATGKKFSESERDMLKTREKINVILKRYGLEPCGKIENIAEDKLEEYDSEDSESIDEYEDEEGSTFSLFQMTGAHIFQGQGMIEGERLYSPGMLYAVDTIEPVLIPGMTYEIEAGIKKQKSQTGSISVE